MCPPDISLAQIFVLLQLRPLGRGCTFADNQVAVRAWPIAGLYRSSRCRSESASAHCQGAALALLALLALGAPEGT